MESPTPETSTDVLDLDALAASFENAQVGACTVCVFIQSQPDPEPWDRLLAGPRQPIAVWKVMRQHGYKPTEDPIRNHRNKGHRR